MGDAGEGLIDADARIQERMEELQRERGPRNEQVVRDPELRRAHESLRLARRALECQLNAATHARRRAQLTQAMEDIDRRMAETSALMTPSPLL